MITKNRESFVQLVVFLATSFGCFCWRILFEKSDFKPVFVVENNWWFLLEV